MEEKNTLEEIREKIRVVKFVYTWWYCDVNHGLGVNVPASENFTTV